MSERDHYRVLGVSRAATTGEIHESYRELAKLCHPDHPGGSDEAFQELARAYEVLSDPELRRTYDEQAAIARRRPHVAPAGAEPLVPRPRAEPLGAPVSLFADARSARPSLDALLERWLRNFGQRAVPKAERAEPLAVEIVLSPEEAEAGGVLPLAVPIDEACPRCRGTGHEWLFPCPACDGRGRLESESLVRIPIPPAAAPLTIERSLADVGVENFYLRLYVRVAP